MAVLVRKNPWRPRLLRAPEVYLYGAEPENPDGKWVSVFSVEFSAGAPGALEYVVTQDAEEGLSLDLLDTLIFTDTGGEAFGSHIAVSGDGGLTWTWGTGANWRQTDYTDNSLGTGNFDGDNITLQPWNIADGAGMTEINGFGLAARKHAYMNFNSPSMTARSQTRLAYFHSAVALNAFKIILAGARTVGAIDVIGKRK